jgi:hypothetical protein
MFIGIQRSAIGDTSIMTREIRIDTTAPWSDEVSDSLVGSEDLVTAFQLGRIGRLNLREIR